MKTCALIAVVLACLAMPWQPAALGQGNDPAALPPMGPVDTYIQQLRDDPKAATAATDRARDATIAAWPASGDEALVDAIEHHAITQMAADLPDAERAAIADLWKSNPDFVGALARVYTDSNNGVAVADLARGIASDHPDALKSFPELAAAVCVVLDRSHTYPGLGAIKPSGVEVFEGLVYAFEDRRVMALAIDELPAEILVYMADIALTGDGMDQTIEDRRGRSPLELYRQVPYKQAGLLAGEAAPTPADFTFDAIANRGGLGPLRSFYAEQLGQIFGWPVAIATGRLAEERFQAPVFLEGNRRHYSWNLEAIPDHPGMAFGTTEHPVTHKPMPLAELVASADLARAGVDATRKAWAFQQAAKNAEPAVRASLLKAAQDQTLGFPHTWGEVLSIRLDEAKDEPTGPQRVLTEFFDRTSQLSPILATDLALEAIGRMDARSGELREWMSLTSRRDPHRYAAAQIAIGDTALESGDRAAAMKTYEDLLNRQADATPLAMDAMARIETMLTQDGRSAEVMELYARTHRRLRAPRTSQEDEVRASAFMTVGERYEQMLLDAGRQREAERLRQQLDRELR